jgi:hypothetical protein
MQRTYLYVPYEERAEVRALGAMWDERVKCWYIEPPAQRARFSRWLSTAADAPFSIVSSDARVLAASTECWRCERSIEVICIYCESGTVDGEDHSRFTVSNISAVDICVMQQLRAWPFFRFGYCKAAGGTYLINHCVHCAIPQADYFLHYEPTGVFFAPHEDRAGSLRVTRLQGEARLTGDEGFAP